MCINYQQVHQVQQVYRCEVLWTERVTCSVNRTGILSN